MKQQDSDKKIKVAIADDHALFRAGVKTALSVKKDVELIAEADNGMQLLNLLRHIEPDVILLDIQMPIMDGIECLQEIRADPHFKLIPVIMLTTSKQDEDHIRSYELGCNTFIEKPVDFAKFSEAIRAIQVYWTLSVVPGQQ